MKKAIILILLLIPTLLIADEYEIIKTNEKVIITTNQPRQAKLISNVYIVNIYDWYSGNKTSYKAYCISNRAGLMYICIDGDTLVVLLWADNQFVITDEFWSSIKKEDEYTQYWINVKGMNIDIKAWRKDVTKRDTQK